MSMELTFNKSGNRYVAEFLATSDFNLHVERDDGGFLYVQQRTSEGGDYDSVRDASFALMDKVVDYDFTALVYPKTIKVVSEALPTYASIVSLGEITEIKSQAKSIEITSNGTTEITPDAGFAYLNSVKVKTNVPMSGGGNVSSVEYLDMREVQLLRDIFFAGAYVAKGFIGDNVWICAPYMFLYMSSANNINFLAVDMNQNIALGNGSWTLKEALLESGYTEEQLAAIPRITKEEFYNLES